MGRRAAQLCSFTKGHKNLLGFWQTSCPHTTNSPTFCISQKIRRVFTKDSITELIGYWSGAYDIYGTMTLVLYHTLNYCVKVSTSS